MKNFEDQANSLVATAASLASLRGSFNEAGLLDNAKATLVQTGHDNWDGGIDIYALMLEVDIKSYAEIESERTNLEATILDRMQQLIRGYNGVGISEVVISPILIERNRPTSVDDASVQIRSADEFPESIPSYWQPGHFRLFISHAMEKRESAHRLKEALSIYQIAAFVAHDDIEPTKEWQAEIETALRTMDGLAAIISSDFLSSKWCDQEVGIAIGRGKLVVPLRVGADPHGFLGKYQGLQTVGRNATVIARQLFEILMRHDLTSPRLTDSLVERLVSSKSWSSSNETMSLLEHAHKISISQAGRLIQSVEENAQVGGAIGVPERIKELVSRKT